MNDFKLAAHCYVQAVSSELKPFTVSPYFEPKLELERAKRAEPLVYRFFRVETKMREKFKIKKLRKNAKIPKIAENSARNSHAVAWS